MIISKEKIQILLAREKVTASEFCENAGMSRNRFYAMLRQKGVTPKTAGKLADALGVDVTEIIETE